MPTYNDFGQGTSFEEDANGQTVILSNVGQQGPAGPTGPAGADGAGFVAASATEVLTGTDASKGITPDALAALWEQGSDVASAGTINLGEGGFFNVTGTTTITDIDFGTDKAGRTAWVKFAGALTLTHNASTLILPGGANITTAAGDTALFVSEGADAVRCLAYHRASGAALVSSGGTPAGTSFPGSPATNDKYYRTDRALEYYYDGTRWLTTQLFTLQGHSAFGPTSNSEGYSTIPFSGVYDLYMVEMQASMYRPATGEWDVRLNYINSANSVTLIATADGNPHANGTWYHVSVSIGSVLSSSAKVLNWVYAEISGTTSFYGTALLLYRLVG